MRVRVAETLARATQAGLCMGEWASAAGGWMDVAVVFLRKFLPYICVLHFDVSVCVIQ